MHAHVDQRSHSGLVRTMDRLGVHVIGMFELAMASQVPHPVSPAQKRGIVSGYVMDVSGGTALSS